MSADEIPVFIGMRGRMKTASKSGGTLPRPNRPTRHYRMEGSMESTVLIISDHELFWSHVIPTGFCWLWEGGEGGEGEGYGRARVNGSMRAAHRVAYEALVGAIPDGMQLDHLCRIHLCVNPDHLEPVTPQENTLRGFGPAGINARKTHCIHGHEFTPENTYIKGGWRICRECKHVNQLSYYRNRIAREALSGTEETS